MREETYAEEANVFYQREMEAAAKIVRYAQMDTDEYLEERESDDDTDDMPESQEEYVAELRSENNALHVEEFRAVEILTTFTGPLSCGYFLFFSDMGHGDWKVVRGLYYYRGVGDKQTQFWLTVPQLDMVTEAYEVEIAG